MTPKEAKKYVENLRADLGRPKFVGADTTEPTKRNPYPKGSYCVGGALLLKQANAKSAGEIETFPDEMAIGKGIQALNPNIESYRACEYGGNIINNNDTSKYVKAWRYLEEALCYPEKPLENKTKKKSLCAVKRVSDEKKSQEKVKVCV